MWLGGLLKCRTHGFLKPLVAKQAPRQEEKRISLLTPLVRSVSTDLLQKCAALASDSTDTFSDQFCHFQSALLNFTTYGIILPVISRNRLNRLYFLGLAEHPDHEANQISTKQIRFLPLLHRSALLSFECTPLSVIIETAAGSEFQDK